MARQDDRERNLDPGIKLVLEEIRDLRVEMRADRQRADEERQRADEHRQRADEQRQRADEAWREERRRADAAWAQERRQADEAWKKRDEEWRRESREFREEFNAELARRDAAFLKAFKEVRTVGLAIVKTLNRHTVILERIDRRLAASPNGRRGRNGGRGG